MAKVWGLDRISGGDAVPGGGAEEGFFERDGDAEAEFLVGAVDVRDVAVERC